MSVRRLLLSAAAMLPLSLAMVPRASAAYIITITQVGPNVVASGSGTLNVTSLNRDPESWSAGLEPANGGVWVGTAGNDDWFANGGANAISGPASIGTGDHIGASSVTGSQVGIYGSSHQLIVPRSYVSGTSITGTATYDNTTLSSLGLDLGTYMWTWGSGGNADSLTVIVGSLPVPEPGTLVLLGTAMTVVLLGRRQVRR